MPPATAMVIASLALAGAGMRLEVKLHGEPRLSGEGSIDPAKVQAVISRHRGVLAACFEREAMRGAEVAGRLVLAWRILPDGTVASVHLVPGKSTVRNASVESCVFRQAMRWRFPPPSDGEVMVVQALLARFEESPRHERRWVAHSDPTVSMVPPEKGSPARFEPCRVTSGMLAPDALRSFLGERQQHISACLARVAAPLAPSLAPDAGPVARALGNLDQSSSLQRFIQRPRPFPVAAWTVSPEGTSSDVQVTRDSVRQKGAEACLRGVLLGWRFPRRDASAAVSCTFF